MKRAAPLLLIIAFACAAALPAVAQETGSSPVCEGQYFVCYADQGLDAYQILSKLDFNSVSLGDAVKKNNGTDIASVLSKTLDGLYQEVSDILDIHIYSFKGTIQFVADQPTLARLMKKRFNLDFAERSIYYHEKNVIFVSVKDMTVGILGHEMGHAIISHFFIVPPPPKIQEVLCGYVEYSLRKNHSVQ